MYCRLQCGYGRYLVNDWAQYADSDSALILLVRDERSHGRIQAVNDCTDV